MEVKLQLKTAAATVASSLGYESSVSEALESAGHRMYPIYPGTQDSKQATMFRVPVSNQEEADRVLDLLRNHEGVQSTDVA